LNLKVEPSKIKMRLQKPDFSIFHSSASTHIKCHRSALSAKVEHVIPTEACFPHLSSSASIRSYSLPHISHSWGNDR